MAKAKRTNKAASRLDDIVQPDNLDQASAWDLSGADIDRLLATDNDARLKQLFGDDYESLRALAIQAQQGIRAPGRKVIIVPGILGSTLGTPGNFITRNTIWFDPTSLAKGDASLLRLDANNRCEPLGVVPIAHTYLRLRLRMHGFEVDYFPYDWRTSIVDAGKKLAAHIKETDATYVVAHSMGGLVTRAALKLGAKNITRVVMIGTPNQGSFSPVQVLQGINGTVTLIDSLDSQHTAAELVRDVFSTFPSLYEMLPRPTIFNELDLFDSASWPQQNYVPASARLNAVSAAWKNFVEKDSRLCLIAGVAQPTVTSIGTGDAEGFVYHSSAHGDGTVPLVMCELPEVPTWYHPATHTGLLRSESVAKGVVDLLLTGKTNQVSAERPAVTRTFGRTLRNSDYLDDPQHPRLLDGRRARAIQPFEHPLIAEAVMAMSSMPAGETLDQLRQARMAPPGQVKLVEGAGAQQFAPPSNTGKLTAGLTLQSTTIAREHHDQLELELFNGNLFDVPYRAITMGIFSNVDPVGPAHTADELTFGAVSELRTRRMFDASVGKIFVMPTGRNLLKADYIVFAGLGDYNEFALNSESVLRTVSCNILRTLMNCGVDEFATLVFGGSTNLTVRRSVESFIQGYIDALEALGDNPQSIHFRRIAMCEMSAERYGELKDEAYRLGATSMCSKIRLTLHEARYPQTAGKLAEALRGQAPAASTPRARLNKNMVYLNVDLERLRGDSQELDTDQWAVHASLLGAGSRATIYSSAQSFSRTQLDALLADLPQAGLDEQHKLGAQIRDLVLTPDFVRVLRDDVAPDDHLSVIVEPEATRIPWEVMPLLSAKSSTGQPVEQLPCLRGGMSRRFRADGQALAKFLETRQREPVLRVLLIADPTGDLKGAAKEGQELESLINGLPSATAKLVLKSEATRQRILQEMGSGAYDVVHYAGHAYFDPTDRSRSGLICAGFKELKRDAVLTGQDLLGLTRLPALVFFNACESGRVRKLAIPDGTIDQLSRTTRAKNATLGDRSRQDAGVCEAMLRGGISQFVGTYWPVLDSSATLFAKEFYKAMINGQTMLDCMQAGRQALEKKGSQDLSNYIHYGDPGFVIKSRPTNSLSDQQ